MELYTGTQRGDMVVLHGDTVGEFTNDDVDDALCFWVDKNLTPEQYLVTWDWNISPVSGRVTVLAEIGEDN